MGGGGKGVGISPKQHPLPLKGYLTVCNYHETKHYDVEDQGKNYSFIWHCLISKCLTSVSFGRGGGPWHPPPLKLLKIVYNNTV